MNEVIYMVDDALQKAQYKHASMRGPHEGYAVILEELDELWDEIKKQHPDPAAMQREALHVAAMAARFVHDVTRPMGAWGSGPTQTAPEGASDER